MNERTEGDREKRREGKPHHYLDVDILAMKRATREITSAAGDETQTGVQMAFTC